MLITFECSVYPNITMFSNVVNKLIVSMGHSGTIPGAVDAGGVSTALEKIVSAARKEMEAEETRNAIALQDDDEFYTSTDKRARSLIQLLRAASEIGVFRSCGANTSTVFSRSLFNFCCRISDKPIIQVT